MRALLSHERYYLCRAIGASESQIIWYWRYLSPADREWRLLKLRVAYFDFADEAGGSSRTVLSTAESRRPQSDVWELYAVQYEYSSIAA